jgi:hypothetical protein
VNVLSILLKSTECNGWPKLKVRVNGCLVHDVHIDQEFTNIDVCLDTSPGEANLVIERYGKGNDNIQLDGDVIIKDQLVEITRIAIDGVQLPQWFLWNNIFLKIDDKETNSLVAGPNGIWTLKLQTPVISFVLEDKILHEAKYSQDYLYPWSYKLGPNSATQLVNDLQLALDLVNKKL